VIREEAPGAKTWLQDEDFGRASFLERMEEGLRRALVIDENSFGPDHARVAIDLNNLAMLLQATNRLAEAEPLMRRALAIDEKSFAPDHPNLGRDLNNLATLLKATGRLTEAEPLLRRALAIFEHSLGEAHPSTLTVRANYEAIMRDLRNSNCSQAATSPMTERDAQDEKERGFFGRLFGRRGGA
jgi:tetratricopeptide (TPR) repeat protein